MIKLILGNKDGPTTWMFGLSEGNLRLLKQGKPILFDLAEMGLPPQQVAIFYGETEEIMETQVRKAFARDV